LVIAAFVLGFFPLYIFHRTTTWRMKRRILTLEGNQKTYAPPPPVAAPAYSSGDAI
jgi:lipopolysaccharide assembly protein A